jgi:hypothetical protein
MIQYGSVQSARSLSLKKLMLLTSWLVLLSHTDWALCDGYGTINLAGLVVARVERVG